MYDISYRRAFIFTYCHLGDIVQLVLSSPAVSPNSIYPSGSTTTALHLATSLGRADVVSMLLDQVDIDDSLRDSDGRMAVDYASKEVKAVFTGWISRLNVLYRGLLRGYIASTLSTPPSQSILALLASPRARHIDLSWLDKPSGTTLLHEAARRKDLRLVELVVQAGADVFVRDRRGRRVGETDKSSGRSDDRVKVFLRQCVCQGPNCQRREISN